jgi:hypothetical protein
LSEVLSATKTSLRRSSDSLELVLGWLVAGAYAQLPARSPSCIAEEWRMTGNWKLGAFAIILAAFSSKSASTAGCVGRSTHYLLLVDVSGTPTQATRPGEKIGSTRRNSVCDAVD